MYIFGGYDGSNRVNDFYSFDLKMRQWNIVPAAVREERVRPSRARAYVCALPPATMLILPNAGDARQGVPPSPRDRHVAAVYGNSFYVFAGFDGTSRVNDFHEYSFDTHQWAPVGLLSGVAPSPRSRRDGNSDRGDAHASGGAPNA